MGVATRDFIPQEEGMTEYERAAQARGKMIRTGANHQDFIADPNDPIPPANTMSKEDRMDAAQAAANKRSVEGERSEWLVARSRLQGWSTAEAVNAIGGMPFRVMEMYLTVERAHAAREDLLRNFPIPPAEMAEQYRLMTADLAHEVELLAPSEDEPEETSILGVADLGDSEPAVETVTEAQTYDCFDCDFQAKSLGGLKAHERAKHGIGDDAEAVSTEPQAGE